LSKLISKGEFRILLVSIAFQIIALITVLRVATGIASASPPTLNQTTSPIIIIPKSANQSVSIPASTPQFVNPAGGGLDASLILVILFLAANTVVIGFLAYLYRKKRMKFFSLVVSIFLIFNVTELYSSFILGLSSAFPLVFSFAAVAVTLFAAFRGMGRITNFLALILALELGSSFPVLLQAPLNWIIPAVYAVFDVYAVYFGRLGRLVKDISSAEPSASKTNSGFVNSAKEGQNDKRPGRLKNWNEFGLLAVNLGDMEIGMADLAFYAMLPAVALLLVNLIAFFVTMLFVDAGLILSFKVFQRKEVSPGLPIPILCGLAGLLLLILLP